MAENSGRRRRQLRDSLISLVDTVLPPHFEPGEAQPPSNAQGDPIAERSASGVEAQHEQETQSGRRVRAELGHRRRFWRPLRLFAWTGAPVLLAFAVLLAQPQLPGRLATNAVDAWTQIRQAFMIRDELQERVAITVQSPSVQTRERLINDRFEQVAWADMLLKSTMKVPPPGTPLRDALPAASAANDARGHIGATAVSGMDQPAEKLPARDGEAVGSPGLTASSQTRTALTQHGGEQRDWFEQVLGFRDLVRAERADAMLDDRHDMDGDTLYNLRFDTTVIPAPGLRGFGAIRILLTNDPSELDRDLPDKVMAGRQYALARFGALQRRDVFEIYLDWQARAQKVIDSGLENLVKTLSASLAEPASLNVVQDVRFLLSLRTDLCELMAQNAAQPQQQKPGDHREQDDVEVLLKLAQHRSDDDNQTRAACRALFSRLPTRPPPAIPEAVKKSWAILKEAERPIESWYDAHYRNAFRDDMRKANPALKTHLEQLKAAAETHENDPGASRLSPWDLARLDEFIANPEAALPSYESALAACKSAPPDARHNAVQALHEIEKIFEKEPEVPPEVPLFFLPCPRAYTIIDKLRALEAILDFIDSAHNQALTDDVELNIGDQDPADSENLHVKLGFSNARNSGDPPVYLQALGSLSCIAARALREQLIFGTPNVVPGRGGPNYKDFFFLSLAHVAGGDCSLRLLPKAASLSKRTDATEDTAPSKIINNPECKSPVERPPPIELGQCPFNNDCDVDSLKLLYSPGRFIPIRIGDNYYPVTEVIRGAKPDAPVTLTVPQCVDREDLKKGYVHHNQREHVLGLLKIILEGPTYSGETPYPTTEAFAYGLTPRLGRSFTLRGRERSGVNAAVSGYGVGVGSQSDVSSEIGEADVAGFNPHPKDLVASGRAAEFGWIVAPQATGVGVRALPLEEKLLGALVAVPGWWRTALLRVCTAGVAEDELPKIDDPRFWGTRGQCRVEALRLPGTGAELSRRFGFEVLTAPFVLSPEPFDLRAGSRAKLLLEGSRLWRSTVVTLGGQRADQITVLPDMNAIVAEFDCVETPSSARSKSKEQGKVYYGVPVRVWTSEGVANPGYGADVFVPQEFKGCGAPEGASQLPFMPPAAR